jgi:uncharacterized cupredoxin-like copper-binding protein
VNQIHSILAGALVACSLLVSTAQAAGDHGKHGSTAMKKEQKEWGIAGDARAAKRTIQITMSDQMRFSPDVIEVTQGETVRLVVKNTGKVMHELVIGTRKDLDEHAALMVKFPGMEHDEPYMMHVRAGKTSSLAWTFNRVGEFDFACLIPGHYQGGMVGRIRVVEAQGKDGHGKPHKH